MEDFFMSSRTKFFRFMLSLIFGIFFLASHSVFATNGVTLYTPYTKISVPPGESIDFSIDAINNSSEPQNLELSLSGMPKGWNYTLKAGGWSVSQISVLPGEKKSFSLKIDVPLQVNKGNYRFKVIAGGFCSLPLVINVSKQGTFKTDFSTNQANMEGQAKSTFTFNTTIKNCTADKQLYALMANSAPGWEVAFKSNYKQVTSVEVEPNNTSALSVEIKAPENIEAGKYEIPLKATTNSTSASLNVQVVITGSYNMVLTTPTGLLSTHITAGDVKKVELLVKNTGTSPLNEISFEYAAPTNWDVAFEPKKVIQLAPGAETHVYATIKADKKAIPGDYVTDISAKSPEISSKASFRVSVKTSMLWGWVGMLIIAIALGSVYYLFRKYGRR
jgi:uncharacterized membrane protein